MTEEKSGVKSEAMISPTAKTTAKAVIIDTSQFSPITLLRMGISLTKGWAAAANIKAKTAAPIHPAMAKASRTKPRE